MRSNGLFIWRRLHGFVFFLVSLPSAEFYVQKIKTRWSCGSFRLPANLCICRPFWSVDAHSSSVTKTLRGHLILQPYTHISKPQWSFLCIAFRVLFGGAVPFLRPKVLPQQHIYTFLTHTFLRILAYTTCPFHIYVMRASFVSAEYFAVPNLWWNRRILCREICM